MNAPTCEICNEHDHKYKCPTCLVKYCSVACYRSHKENSKCEATAVSQAAAVQRAVAVSASQPQPVNLSMLQLPTRDTVPVEALQGLRESSDVHHMLESPALRGRLQELAACSSERQAGPMLAGLIKEDQSFRQFAGACLQVVEPENNTFKEELDSAWR